MEEVIAQVKNGWSKDLIIRFLYIKLAPYFQRDLSYFLADDEEKKRQYEKGFINRCPYVVCSTLADYYVKLFNEFGIDAKKVVANSADIPLFAVIVSGDYGWYFMSPLNDLFANQYGLKSDHFGIIPRYQTIRRNHPELISLDPLYVEELDQELNLKYMNDYFDNLHSILTQRKTVNEYFSLPPETRIDLRERKLELYNEKFINLGEVNGPFERALMYQFLNDQLLNHTEKKYVLVKALNDERYYVSFSIINPSENTLFLEEKINGEYVLVKKGNVSKRDD